MNIASFAKIYKYWKEECLLDAHHWEEQGQEKPVDSPLPLPLLPPCPSLSFLSYTTTIFFYFFLPHIYC